MSSPLYSSRTLSAGDVVNCELSAAVGCISPSSANVEPTIYPVPVLANIQPIALIEGQSIVLELAVPAGNTDDYLWSPATGLSDPTIADPVANPLATTTYTLLVTTTDGCQVSGDLTLKVVSKDRRSGGIYTQCGRA
jgi:hypothetical protein